MASSLTSSSLLDRRSQVVKELYAAVNKAKVVFNLPKHNSHGEAITLCKDAIDRATRELGPQGDEDPHVLDAREERARLLAIAYAKHPYQAITEYEEIITRREFHEEPNSRKLAKTRLCLVRTLWQAENRTDASGHLIKVIDTFPDVLNHDDDLRMATSIGTDLLVRREYGKAQKILDGIFSQLEVAGKENGLRALEARRVLAETLYNPSINGGQHANWDNVRLARGLIQGNISILENAYSNKSAFTENYTLLAGIENLLVKEGRLPKNDRTQLPTGVSLHVDILAGIGGVASETWRQPDTLKSKLKGLPKILDYDRPLYSTEIPDSELPAGQSNEYTMSKQELRAKAGLEADASHVSSPSPTAPRSQGHETASSNSRGLTKPIPVPQKAHTDDESIDSERQGSLAKFFSFFKGKKKDAEKVKDDAQSPNLQNKETPHLAANASGYTSQEDIFPLDSDDGSDIDRKSAPEVPSKVTKRGNMLKGRWLDTVGNENDVVIPLSKSADADLADKWFEDLQLTHNLFGDRALTNHPVKIALLDSGIDGRHPFLYPKPFGKGWGERIRGWLDFDANGKELIQHDSDWTNWIKTALWRDHKDLYQPYQDRDGHGTHCAGLILQVAPHAHLYVARVGTGRSCDPDPEVVAKAIKYATGNGKEGSKGWDVDIISMSFGFEESPRAISKAISDYCDQKVLFAAAANYGGRSDSIAFPAKMDRVICVKSCNGDGDRSTFNPWNSKDAGPNFMTLGKDVLSMWRVKDWDEMTALQKRSSGTSVATPIAAGIAALVIHFLRQPDEFGKEPYLKESLDEFELDPRDKMKKILVCMSEECIGPKHDTLRFVQPWKILTTAPKEKGSPRDIAARELHNVLCGRGR